MTHSAGVARAVAEWLVDGRPARRPARVRARPVRAGPARPGLHRGARPPELHRGLRRHPSAPADGVARARCAPAPSTRASGSSGAYFLEAARLGAPALVRGRTRAARSSGMATLPEPRDEWAARYWSPIAAAEASATRERVALYDMTPLKRLEVTGPGALGLAPAPDHQRRRQAGRRGDLHAAARPRRRASAATSPWPGSARTGSRSARTATSTWTGSPGTPGRRRRHGRATSPPGTCCIGVWGPLARELVQPLTDDGLLARRLPVLPGQAGIHRPGAGDRDARCRTSASSAGSCTPPPTWA